MKNVLLVDDDKIFNYLNAKVIEQIGVAGEIHTALNGRDAITLINEYFQGSRATPDIILLDLNMPIMDGFGFIDAFRRLTIPGIENVKIIIVTSSDDPRDVAKAKALGIRNYLTKPVSEQDLRVALSNVD
jgi:CheY-like chemotaxis protein